MDAGANRAVDAGANRAVHAQAAARLMIRRRCRHASRTKDASRARARSRRYRPVAFARPPGTAVGLTVAPWLLAADQKQEVTDSRSHMKVTVWTVTRKSDPNLLAVVFNLDDMRCRGHVFVP